MKNKINAWLDKPWTNRTYLKICGYVLGAYTVVMAGVLVKCKLDEREYEREIEGIKNEQDF